MFNPAFYFVLVKTIVIDTSGCIIAITLWSTNMYQRSQTTQLGVLTLMKRYLYFWQVCSAIYNRLFLTFSHIFFIKSFIVKFCLWCLFYQFKQITRLTCFLTYRLIKVTWENVSTSDKNVKVDLVSASAVICRVSPPAMKIIVKVFTLVNTTGGTWRRVWNMALFVDMLIKWNISNKIFLFFLHFE